MLQIILSYRYQIIFDILVIEIGRVPLAHIPIAHIHSNRPCLEIFPLDHQSENFILN